MIKIEGSDLASILSQLRPLLSKHSHKMVWAMNTEELINFIRHMLSCPEEFIRETVTHRLTIKTRASRTIVQKETFEWLRRRVEDEGTNFGN